MRVCLTRHAHVSDKKCTCLTRAAPSSAQELAKKTKLTEAWQDEKKKDERKKRCAVR